MADWQDKVLNAPTPKATAQAFKPKRVKDVLTNSTPGTTKKVYKARPAATAKGL